MVEPGTRRSCSTRRSCGRGGWRCWHGLPERGWCEGRSRPMVAWRDGGGGGRVARYQERRGEGVKGGAGAAGVGGGGGGGNHGDLYRPARLGTAVPELRVHGPAGREPRGNAGRYQCELGTGAGR